MKEIRLEAKSQEELVRTKFEKVVEQLNADRTHLIESFSIRIESLEKGQEKLLSLLEPLQIKIHEIEIERKLEKQHHQQK